MGILMVVQGCAAWLRAQRCQGWSRSDPTPGSNIFVSFIQKGLIFDVILIKEAVLWRLFVFWLKKKRWNWRKTIRFKGLSVHLSLVHHNPAKSLHRSISTTAASVKKKTNIRYAVTLDHPSSHLFPVYLNLLVLNIWCNQNHTTCDLYVELHLFSFYHNMKMFSRPMHIVACISFVPFFPGWIILCFMIWSWFSSHNIISKYLLIFNWVFMNSAAVNVYTFLFEHLLSVHI